MSAVLRHVGLLFAALLFVVSGCKQTAESQSAAWNANVAKVEKLQAQYPGFKPALEARLTAARPIFESASSMSGEAQVDKMGEANRALMNGFVSELPKLEATIKSLRDARVEAAAKAGDESSRLAAKVAAEDAGKALDRVEKMLADGAPDDASAAAVLAKINADLAAAQSAVDKVLAVDKEKKDAKDADAKAKADAEAADKAAAEAKVADWACEYCGSKNKHDQTSCQSCGAPRKGAD